MTAKRYRKLAMAEMSKLMMGHEKAGYYLKTCRTATPIWDKVPGRSYQGAWDMVLPTFANMPYNAERVVPVK